MENVTLKEHLEDKIKQERELREIQLKDKTLALEIAREDINRRLEQMNELRQQINEERIHYFPRAEYAFFKDKIEGEIRLLRDSKVAIESKASQLSVLITLGLSILGIFLSILSFLFRK